MDIISIFNFINFLNLNVSSEEYSGVELKWGPLSASALSGKAITPAGHIRQNIYMPGLFLTRPNLFSVTLPTIHPRALILLIYIDFYWISLISFIFISLSELITDWQMDEWMDRWINEWTDIASYEEKRMHLKI